MKVMSLEDARKDLFRRVQNGVKWLDQEHEGWRDRIDVDLIDMGSVDVCVLAQLFGHADEYDKYGRAALRLRLNEKKCEGRGFDVPDALYEAGVTYNDLTEAWKKELA